MSNLPYTSGSSVPSYEAERLFLLFNGGLYGSFILATVIVYDSTLTFDKEVEFIWHNLRSISSWIFFLNRYFGMAAAIVNVLSYLFRADSFTCRMSVWIFAISNAFTIMFFDYILVQRVMAVYCRSKAISRVLFTLLSMEFVFGLAFYIYNGVTTHVSVELMSSNAAFCMQLTPKAGIVIIRLTWALPVITGLIFMILLLYKSMQYRKESCSDNGYSLIGLLIRDQARYFLVVVISSVAGITSYAFSNPVVITVFATIATSTMPCVIGSRLIINLKVDGGARANGGTDTGTELTTVEFTHALGRDVSEYRSEDIAT